MSKDDKKDPLDITPSDDFPKMEGKLEVNLPEFDINKDTTPLPYPPLDAIPVLDTDIGCTVKYEIPNTPEDTPPIGCPNLDIPVAEDFSFGGSAEEVAEAVKRNAELADKGFSLSNTEDESLRPKVFDENGTQLNTIACDVDLGDDTPRVDLDFKGFEKPTEIPTSFVPRKDDSDHWKRLYFAQKGITATLEKIIEEMQ